MFDFFIPFYIAVFNIYYVSLIMPLSLRLNGTFAYILTIGWLNFTKPYPELGDLSLYLTLLLLLQPVFKYLSYFIISTLLLLVSIVLAPIFYHLWIDLGSGNSNFFYAITLSYSLGIASTVADFAWGYLVQEYHELNQDKNVNKKITQI
jgi:phosphatidylinositol glycan class U